MRISDWSSAVCSSDRVEAETGAYGGCRDRDDEGRNHVLRRHLPRQRPRERSAQQSKDCRRSILREAYGYGIAAGKGGDDEHYHRPDPTRKSAVSGETGSVRLSVGVPLRIIKKK